MSQISTFNGMEIRTSVGRPVTSTVAVGMVVAKNSDHTQNHDDTEDSSKGNDIENIELDSRIKKSNQTHHTPLVRPIYDMYACGNQLLNCIY
jgi:hypothetical protein